MIKVGVIGWGYAAQTFHQPLIEATESMELVAICSSKVEALKEQFPEVSVFRTPDDLITKSGVDLVVVTAPNQAHYGLAKMCLDHRIHVLVEKPMATSSAEAQALVELAKKQSVLLSVFHNRRWDGDFLTVKKLIEDKAIGEVRLFESHFDRFRPEVRRRWRELPGEGTGIWYDLGAHLVDQALCLFGMPKAVTARCLASREQACVTDYFHVLLHYKGLEVILHASSLSAGPNRRFQLEGSGGSYVKYGLDPQEGQLKDGVKPGLPDFGLETADSYGTLYTESGQQQMETLPGHYQSYYQGIAEAIQLSKESPVTAEQALQVIRLIELAEQSNKLGVTLSVDEH